MFTRLVKFLGMDDTTLPIPLIKPFEAYRQSSKGALLLIDVREPHEWESHGSPLNSSCITLQDDAFVDKIMALAENDKTKPLALLCKSGMRGAKAASLLHDDGFTEVMNVEGGMVKWLSEKLPVDEHYMNSIYE